MMKAEAREEYLLALKNGQKEYREAKQNKHPLVLDEILPDGASETYVDVGLVEIPAERIIGVKSAGRITAFSPSFLPLLEPNTEFAAKWIDLCQANLEEGIREPIVCYEYLGDFYVQEGNKRVSVLRHFGAPRIPGTVRRVMPREDTPRTRAYLEFLEFFKATRVYELQFQTPGSYQKLASAMGRELGTEITEWERRTLRAYIQYFREAFAAEARKAPHLTWEEALLLWLEVYSFRDIGRLSADELQHTLASLLGDLEAIAREDAVEVSTEPVRDSGSIGSLLSRLILPMPEQVQVAFVHTLDTEVSAWIKGHDVGREYLEQQLGDQVQVRSYFHADSPREADRLLDLAVEEGADVVFTTTPQLGRATTRAAIRHPRVRFLNCSVDVPYSSIRAYYGRIFEAKFITGAIAGAMANYDHIGYVGSYPIYGVPASINAFALGAQMTNPRARVDLRWSCLPGNAESEFISRGYEVISNRDVPIRGQSFADHGAYGTYVVGKEGILTPLASPIWDWGKFYEKVVRDILEGRWEHGKSHKALSFWWGMDSGVIDVELAPHLPDSIQYLAKVLRTGLKNGTLDPFARRIVAQDGSVKNPDGRPFTPDELLRMDWLCENITGSIPEYEEVLPLAQTTVRELGLHRERIPKEKEADAL